MEMIKEKKEVTNSSTEENSPVRNQQNYEIVDHQSTYLFTYMLIFK